MTPRDSVATPRTVWIALILLAAAMVSAAAGLLSYAGGANVPTAILAAGGAYASTVALLLALAAYAAGDRT